MVIGANVIIGNEMFGVVSFPTASSVRLNRAQEGTTAAAHAKGATVYTVLKDPKVDNGIATTFVDTVTPISTTATQLTVDNVTDFAINDFIFVGYGSGGNEEFMQVSGTPVVTSGNSGYLPVTRADSLANWPGAAKTHSDGETVWRVLTRETTVLEDAIPSTGTSVVAVNIKNSDVAVSYTHLRAHETPEHRVSRRLG